MAGGGLGLGWDGVSEVEGVKNERREERKKEEREELTKFEVSGTAGEVHRRSTVTLPKHSLICNTYIKHCYWLLLLTYY